MAKRGKPLAVLDNVLWVPSDVVDDQTEDFTYRFETVTYEPQLHLPSKCSNCDLWNKKWRPGRRTCADLGYALHDVCGSFTHRKFPVREEHIVKTWKEVGEWTVFARGDLDKIENLFGHLGIDDQRAAPRLDFPLECKYTLFPWQQKVVDQWLEHGYGILQAPTGWGKSIAWAWLIAKLRMRTLLLAQETRHVTVAYEAMMAATNIAELEQERGEKLVGRINKKYKITGEDPETGLPIWRETASPGAHYPITLGTFQSFTSKRGIKLRKKLKNDFGVTWLEECLSGDTLVPTKRGLLRIDEIAEGKSQYIQEEVATRWGTAPAVRWIAQGEQETLRVETSLGNSVTCTFDHELLVLDPESYNLEWRRASLMQPGDLLCVPQFECTRTDPLLLPEETGLQKMTPELAFVLGCIVAEGGIYSQGRVQITNANEDLLDIFESRFHDVWGKKPRRRLQYPQGSKVEIRGDKYESKVDCFESTACSFEISGKLEALGVSRVTAPYKTVPWSVLQADKVSQEAFLAAYVECDGFVAQESGHFGFSSASQELLEQIQSILFSHGYSGTKIKWPSNRCGYVRVSNGDSDRLQDQLAPWLVSKALDIKPRRGPKLLGIPAQGVTSLFRERLVPSEGSRRCRMFTTDDGHQVAVPGVEKNFIYEYAAPRKTLTYSHTGDRVIEQVSAFSPSTHEKLSRLRDLRYRYVPVRSITPGGIREVYDLTMEDHKNRSFIANGVVSSNCHHESARTFHQVTKSFNPFYRGGQTATPSRKDQTEVAIFDTIGPVTARGTKESMNPIVMFHNTNVFVPDSKFKYRYPKVQVINHLAKNKKYNEDLLENVLLEIEEGRKVLVITERVAHGISLVEKIKIHGYGAVFEKGGQKKKKEHKEQSWYAEELLKENLHCIVGTKVLNENWDVPPLDSIHIPFPSFTRETEEQRVGRIRRPILEKWEKFMEEHGIDWAKPQPRVHVYTWTCNDDDKGGNYARSATYFRVQLFKSWGFDFDDSVNHIETTHKKKSLKDLMGDDDDDDD